LRTICYSCPNKLSHPNWMLVAKKGGAGMFKRKVVVGLLLAVCLLLSPLMVAGDEGYGEILPAPFDIYGGGRGGSGGSKLVPNP